METFEFSDEYIDTSIMPSIDLEVGPAEVQIDQYTGSDITGWPCGWLYYTATSRNGWVFTVQAAFKITPDADGNPVAEVTTDHGAEVVRVDAAPNGVSPRPLRDVEAALEDAGLEPPGEAELWGLIRAEYDPGTRGMHIASKHPNPGTDIDASGLPASDGSRWIDDGDHSVFIMERRRGHVIGDDGVRRDTRNAYAWWGYQIDTDDNGNSTITGKIVSEIGNNATGQRDYWEYSEWPGLDAELSEYVDNGWSELAEENVTRVES